ncbi:hypothetical protein Goshw_019327 [Gossypium schwendimanii]|uniref:MATH domain-containing protein n=1 Tax=Gossypium schwendimanii TaxID=34291 RepID=A0A7J9MJ20_GOSSC|nr:hypothetical protein [Gossypium schwendimanii]
MDVNGLITKVTWRVEILSAVHGLSKSLGVNGQITKAVTWWIENFSSIKDPRLYSENFSVDGHKWRLAIFPKGNNVDHLSIYLHVVDSTTLPSGWSTYVQIGLAVFNRFDRELSITKVSTVEFTANDSSWGFPSLLALSELHDPKRGYLIDDAFEPEDPTEEDMNTFFTSLESELSNSNIAFRILACFDCSSTALTIEQKKNELLRMEQSLKELVSQAAKAMQDKNHLHAKESMKLTITRDLDRNLIRYKEIESEFAA